MDSLASAPKRLGPLRIAGYGLGDVGFNFFYTGLNLFLLPYYTDVLGIAPTTAGLIFMLSVIWDAITDPVMGWITTRTRTRLGRYRPYLLFAAPVMGASFVMMFAAPVLFPGAVIAASFLSHMLFRTMFTVVNIPYSALTAAMTQDSKERGKLSGIRMLGAILGGLVAGAVTFGLVKYFGGDDMIRGFVMVSIVYAALATLMVWVSYASTFEPPETKSNAANPTTADTIRFMFSNRAFWVLAAATFATSIGSSIGNKCLAYYVKYVIGDDGAYGPLISLAFLMAALSVPLWIWIAGRLSKRIAWLIAACGLVAVQSSLFLLQPDTVAGLRPFMFTAGLFMGAIPVMFWAMVPDTVEYGQWRSGVRDEAIVMALLQLAMKAATGVGVGILGIALGAAGYVANQAQTPEALEAISAMSFLSPLIGSALAGAIIFFYPIDDHMHGRLRKAIAWRNARQSVF